MNRLRIARVIGRGLALVALLVGSEISALASRQIELGVIQGAVTDENGTPLEGVSFRIRDTGRGREFTIKSDADGKFYRRGLPAVEYEITVEKDGYQTIQDKVRLNAGVDRRFNFKLARASPEGAEEFARGVEAFNRGDAAAAATAFEAAAAKAPGMAEVKVNLALAYLRLNRTADAIAELEKAAAIAPDDARVQFQLGGAYVDLQSYDKAAAAFERGLTLQPDLGDSLAFDATVTLGAVYFAQGNNDKAGAAFTRALAARPGAPAATLGLGKVHFSKGEAEQALRLFDDVVAKHPGTPEAEQAAAFIKELRKGPGPASSGRR